MAFSLARFRDLAYGRARKRRLPARRRRRRALPRRRAAGRGPAGRARPPHLLSADARRRRARTRAARAHPARARPGAERAAAGLGELHLAPRSRENDPDVLGAFFDSASAFADGFAAVLEAEATPPVWIAENLARLIARNLRWLDRRLSLAHMLQLPVAGATWERLRRR